MAGRSLPFLLLACILFSAVGVQAAPPETDSTAQETLRRGIELYQSGQPEEALSRLRGFVLRHSASPLLPEAYLYLARIFLESHRPGEALVYLGRIPPEKVMPEARLLEGVARIDAGEAEKGIDLLLPLDGARLPEADRRLRLTALAEAQAGLGRFLPALYFLQQAFQLPGNEEREKYLQQGHLLLRDRLNDTELAEAAFVFAGTPLGADARLQQAMRAFSRGEIPRARQFAREVVETNIPFPLRPDALHLFGRLSADNPADRSIGVILPLSGRFAEFAQLVRRGMELALQVHGGSAARLFFADTGAEAEKAAQAVSSLANEQRVMAIAGPLTGAAAIAAASRAAQEQVPLLTLSQKEGLAETDGWVFRDSLTSRLQIEALVRAAVNGRGITTFGILFPESRLGKEMAELFSREVARLGGKVVAQEGYGETETDFRRHVRRLQGEGGGPETEPSPVPARPAPFNALFIPDEAGRVGLIVPQLSYYGLQVPQFLGTNGWNSPELLRLAGDSVEGAIFVDGFFRDSPHPSVQEFISLYVEKHGEEPSILEAQGFDAVNILLTILDDPKVRTREDVRLALLGLKNYPGVTGVTTFNPTGEAEKSLFLLQVQEGEIVQIN